LRGYPYVVGTIRQTDEYMTKIMLVAPLPIILLGLALMNLGLLSGDWIEAGLGLLVAIGSVWSFVLLLTKGTRT
jgi:hypothetical protein